MRVAAEYRRRSAQAAAAAILATAFGLAAARTVPQPEGAAAQTQGAAPPSGQTGPSGTEPDPWPSQPRPNNQPSPAWQANLEALLFRDAAGDLREPIREAIDGLPVDQLAAAAVWLGTLPDSLGARQLALNLLVSRWTEATPPAALDFVNSLPAGPGRTQLLSSALLQWSSRDPEGAARWSSQLPGELRSQLAPAMALGLAQQVPEEAGNWVANMEPGPDQRAAALDVVTVWAATDPAAAADWAATFLDSGLRENALQQALRLWAERDWQAAGQWLLSLPGTESRDVLLGTLASLRAAP